MELDVHSIRVFAPCLPTLIRPEFRIRDDDFLLPEGGHQLVNVIYFQTKMGDPISLFAHRFIRRKDLHKLPVGHFEIEPDFLTFADEIELLF